MSELERSAVLAANRFIAAFVDWHDERYADAPDAGDDPTLVRLATEAKRVLIALECDNELIE